MNKIGIVKNAQLAARDQVANRLRGHLKEEQEKIKKLEEKLSQARENDMRSNLIHSKEMEAQKRVLAFAEGNISVIFYS
jgi:predicted RNase H-like nuclease (RuvC/YqgF family)